MLRWTATGAMLVALAGGSHRQRHQPAMEYAVASWYYDAGRTASGWHAYYGVANLFLAFGTRVLVAFHGRSVEAVVDDRGPYVYGRTFDLNENVAQALGFSGVQEVAYRIG
jgi:rare lipoprotein A (peptidoglycan hydrolase)